jgi:isoleucyl-tRNA synthetase
MNANIQKTVLSEVKSHGTDVWFEQDAARFIPEGTACPACGHTKFVKEKDILDVWFDSGVSHQAVLRGNPLLSYPADLYLEGSDQHRGWFQSALLSAEAIGDGRPYRSVLTHGFVVDGEGRKMSKSLGNVIDPLKMLQKHGADILRLWVASMNYFVDVRISDEILGQLSDAYRKIRNTFRFLLANCSDFMPAKHSVPQARMKDIDFFILTKLSALAAECREYYENFEFHRVYRSVSQFCTVDLSSFYLDIMKNKLYTDRPDALDRRSAQTVMHAACGVLCRILAPLVPFTADEVWEHWRAEDDPESVHLALWPDVAVSRGAEAVQEKYRLLLDLRSLVLSRLEDARNRKLIGAALEAKVLLSVGDEALYALLMKTDPKELQELFIVSGVDLKKAPGGQATTADVARADGEKCVRCWQYRASVGREPDHPGLCEDCVSIVTSLIK